MTSEAGPESEGLCTEDGAHGRAASGHSRLARGHQDCSHRPHLQSTFELGHQQIFIHNESMARRGVAFSGSEAVTVRVCLDFVKHPRAHP